MPLMAGDEDDDPISIAPFLCTSLHVGRSFFSDKRKIADWNTSSFVGKLFGTWGHDVLSQRQSFRDARYVNNSSSDSCFQPLLTKSFKLSM